MIEVKLLGVAVATLSNQEYELELRLRRKLRKEGTDEEDT